VHCNFVWIKAAIATALDALPSPSDANTVSILSGVLGVAFTKPRGPWGSTDFLYQEYDDSVMALDTRFQPQTFASLDFWVEFFESNSRWQKQCETGSVKERRLWEDVEIWRILAGISGMRDAISAFMVMKSVKKHPGASLTPIERAQLTYFLLALIRNGAGVTVHDNLDGLIGIIENEGSIIINSRQAPKLWLFVQTLDHLGVPFRRLSRWLLGRAVAPPI
jgi:hypothetical protein